MIIKKKTHTLTESLINDERFNKSAPYKLDISNLSSKDSKLIEENLRTTLDNCTWAVIPGTDTLINMVSIRQMIRGVLSYINFHFKFLFQYANSLKIVYTFNVPTMATDGFRVLINPGFVKWLYDTAQVGGVMFVFVHELFHCLVDHPARMKKDGRYLSNHSIANEAADNEINYLIEQLTDEEGEVMFEDATEICGGCL